MGLPESEQQEITTPSPLLAQDGSLQQVGWMRQPLLDCNLEQVRFYPTLLRPFQYLRIKRWDYYGITTPTHYFSVTLADLGYAGQVFAYVVDLRAKKHHEETLTIPLARSIHLPRNSTEGVSHYHSNHVQMTFTVTTSGRHLEMVWPSFGGADLKADVQLSLVPDHESMGIVIPIANRRFYYNRKTNCLPATGYVQWGDTRHELHPNNSLGNLDWGRGIWEYQSFWVWASASGFLSSQRTIGLNLGFGFGDTSAATENAVILNGRVHKLGQLEFEYDDQDFLAPWQLRSKDRRLDLTFTPFLDRVARTNLLLIRSEVHQLFGSYSGTVIADDGEKITLRDLTGFAEEHHARW